MQRPRALHSPLESCNQRYYLYISIEHIVPDSLTLTGAFGLGRTKSIALN